jgi:DNA-binding NarL/FixJ family response regulator
MEMTVNMLPDIVLADIKLPSVNNVDPVILVHQWNPAQRILVMTDHLSPIEAIRALRNGALGYFVRIEDFTDFSQAIKTVSGGRRYVSRLVTDQILDSIISGKDFNNDVEERISSREREILQLIAEGRTNSEIGRQLVISTRTVETHRTNLMRKLGFSSQADIIRYAFKVGLLTID